MHQANPPAHAPPPAAGLSTADAWRLQADVDALMDRLSAWSQSGPDWPPADECRALVNRLRQRVDHLRARAEAPLVVALLGGTGTGKSSLLNALVGQDVALAGRQRPTTLRPLVVCRAGIDAAALGLDREDVDFQTLEAPLLNNVVLVDCPDPDTTEDDGQRDTNLARLRAILPHCDLLLVAATQQKYRSARVLDELAAAAPGARLVYVQTHADQEDDIRNDWRSVLAGHYDPGEMFLVDSIAALAAARSGEKPSGDFARLVELLTKRLSGSAGNRIRWANFLDLVERALADCKARIERLRPAVDKAHEAIGRERLRLWTRFSEQLRQELFENRRPWDLRLLTEVAARWGMTPFAILLRLFLGLGQLLSGGLLLKVRTPAQLALWGAWEGLRRWQRQSEASRADRAAAAALTSSFGESELRQATFVIAGFAHDAKLPLPTYETTQGEAEAAGDEALKRLSHDLQAVVRRAASRRTLAASRLVYEILWSALLLLLAARWAKNFFYDSWLAPTPQPILGLDYYAGALVSCVVWGGVLIALFTAQARRGLLSELQALFARWSPSDVSPLFHLQEQRIDEIRRYEAECAQLQARLEELRGEVRLPEAELGRARLG